MVMNMPGGRRPLDFEDAVVGDDRNDDLLTGNPPFVRRPHE